ncbi:MAG TPA: outer membrane lipid asymmetry maintenance protein MlaD [Opitutaceae bacterium]
MKRSGLELSVGTFVLAGLLAIGWFAVKTGAGSSFSRSGYEVRARFSDVGGLRAGSPVMIAGVSVGRVSNIVLDEQFAAIVAIRLGADLKLSADTIASIKTNGLMGDKFIALSPGSDAENVPPGGTISDTESAINLESLISRLAFGNVTTPTSTR